ASFGYDGLGRRRSRSVAGNTISFLYDGLNPVQELSGTTPSANLLTGLGIDERFARSDAAGTMSFLTDVIRSTVAITDASSAISVQYTFDPFGGTTTSGSGANVFEYSGRENDGNGLYGFRARYYSPGFGRF